MRILHIVSGMDPEGGGPQEAVRMLLAYSPPGVSNEIGTLDPPEAPFLRGSELPIHPLGKPGGGWFSPRLMPWLRENRARFDGILHHGLWGFTSIATLHTVSGRRPYMVFPHGMLDPYFKRRFPAKHLKKLPFWFGNERWLLSGAQQVLFTAASERDLALQSFPFSVWKPRVVPLGTEPPAFDFATAVSAFQQRCPGVRDKRFLLFLGRLHPKKGCDLLVEAFADAARLDPSLDLVMAGPDANSWMPALQQLATRAGVLSTRIHWPGMLQGQTKWGAFAACEAFILPSHQENFGIAVVEAMACGRPVLLTEPINIAADLAAAGCAFVAPDTLPGVRSLLHQWLATPQAERVRMGERALATFAEHYDMRHNTAAVYAGFQQTGPEFSTPSPVEAR